MNKTIVSSLARLILGYTIGVSNLAWGAIVLESEGNNCSNLVRKLSDLLADGDKDSPTYDLLKNAYAQKLLRDCGLHVVQPNETLLELAQKYGTTVSELSRLNPEIQNARPQMVPLQVLVVKEIQENHLLQSTEASSVD